MVSDCVVEPYNCTLSMTSLLENVDLCIVFDNEALYDICFRTIKLSNPTYGDLNHLIYSAMSAITSRLRFPAQIYPCLRELAYNMVPLPRMHFLMVGFAPLVSRESIQKRELNMAELAQLFSKRNTLCDVNPSHARYFAASAFFRGSIPTNEIEEAMLTMSSDRHLPFVEWMPPNINFSICDTPISGFETAAASIANSTAVSHMF
jgi:tubulin beta